MKRLTTSEFINKSKLLHGDRYDYSESMYINSRTKVVVICKEHGKFSADPYKHIKGANCPNCNDRKIPLTDIINRFTDSHGDLYDYSKVEYKGMHTKVCIVCKKHGDFHQIPRDHIRGSGCSKCGDERVVDFLTNDNMSFVERAHGVHGDIYNYDKVDYVRNDKGVTITCSTHGDFTQSPNSHLNGSGCPKCKYISKYETYIEEFLKTHNIDYVKNTRINGHISGKEANNFELDFYVPSKRIAIEINGIYWHSEHIYGSGGNLREGRSKKYHLNKTNVCEDNDIKLIHIFTNFLDDKRECVMDRLVSLFGISETRIYARKCDIKVVSMDEYYEFMDDNHLQGGVGASHKFGLYHNDELVSCMSFSKPRISMGGKLGTDVFELIRFACKDDITVVGGASRLLKHFIKTVKPTYIKTYADRCWSDGEFYKTLGFEYTHKSRPSYWYVSGSTVYHRYKFRKQRLNKLLEEFDPNLTEYENMLNNGYTRFWDCGCFVFGMDIK